MIYLYIKKCSHCNKRYFGKTTSDPYRYEGSGLWWSRHLKKYQASHITETTWEFKNQEECTNFALSFSKTNNIVESEEWFNVKEENGLDGNPKGITFLNEQCRRLAKEKRGKPLSEEHRKKLSLAGRGKKRSEEFKRKLSQAFKGKPKPFLKGRKISEWQKQRISEATRGKPKHTLDQKEKWSQERKGTRLRGQNSRAKKILVDNIVCFYCIKDACEYFKVCDGSILRKHHIVEIID